jgi:hypothetical protein
MLAWEYDQLDHPPEVTDELIRFNGIGSNGHETFHLPKTMEPGHPSTGKKYRSNFCKTARKPYDAVVCAILLSMHKHAPGAWDIASDGDLHDEEWLAGVELFRQATNAGEDIIGGPWLASDEAAEQSVS